MCTYISGSMAHIRVIAALLAVLFLVQLVSRAKSQDSNESEASPDSPQSASSEESAGSPASQESAASPASDNDDSSPTDDVQKRRR